MNYSEAKLHAELLAAELSVNDTLRTNCPVCDHKTYTVTRLRHSVVWNCYRNSCELKSGHSHTSGLLVPPDKIKPRSKLKPYTGEMLPLSAAQEDFLWERFNWLQGIPDSLKSTNDNRFIFPILNPHNWDRGYNVRNYPESGLSGWTGPKAVVYMHTAEPVMSWFWAGTASPLVLVEDQMSALACQQAGINACALIGTHLNNDKVREIASQYPKEVIIALDADATDQAFKLARKWGLAFNKTRVAVLERDLKDEHDLFDIPEVLGVKL